MARLTPKAILWLLIVFSAIFRLFCGGLFDLAPDEAYYWMWSTRPGWGYLDHPPAIAYLIRLTTLFSKKEFFVRFSGPLIASAAIYLMYELTRLLSKDERLSLFVSILLAISIPLSAGALIMTPDTPLMIFWMLSCFFLVKAVESQKALHWVFTAIFIGLGLLSKYTMVLFLIGAFGFIIASPGQKPTRSTRLFLILTISLAIFTPVIVWNALHGWVSFRFQLSNFSGRGVSTGLEMKPLAFLEFVSGQFFLAGPLIVFFCMAFWMLGFKKGALDPRGRALWWVSIPLILLSLMKSLFGKVEANWPIMAYIGILPVVSERFLWGNGKKERWLRHITLGWAIAAAVIVHLHLLASVIPLPADRDPTSQLRKWSDTAELASELAHQCDTRSSPGIYVIRYQVAAELYYYLGDDIRIVMDRNHARPNVFQFYSEFADPDELKKNEPTLKGGNRSGPRPVLLLDTMPFTDPLLDSFGIDKTRVQQHEIKNDHGKVIRRIYSYCLIENQ